MSIPPEPSGEPEGRDAPPPEVTRIEVIDHRRGAPEVGRVFSAWNARVELSYQDGGRTLKVFVDGDATTENVPPPMLSDEERAKLYAAIRTDRLERGAVDRGAPSLPDENLEFAKMAALGASHHMGARQELTDEQVDTFMLVLCDTIAERVGEAPVIGYTPDEVRYALRAALGAPSAPTKHHDYRAPVCWCGERNSGGSTPEHEGGA